jgi:hypothetical protein
MFVRFLKDYSDRYGVERTAGDEAEYNDSIGAKLVRFRIASVASRPQGRTIAAPEAEETPENTSRPRGRPRKEVFAPEGE